MDKHKNAEDKIANYYDQIIGSCMVNTYSLSNEGKIVLKNFNPQSNLHMFEYQVAAIVQSMYQDRQIYLNMPLMQYLKFKWKNRKKIKLKWISSAEIQKLDLEADLLTDMLLHVSDAYEENPTIFGMIYTKYWGEKND